MLPDPYPDLYKPTLMPPIRTVEEHRQIIMKRPPIALELEKLRLDKSWDRSVPRSGLQVLIALEEIRNDKSWDRNAPKGWIQERAAEDEERERQARVIRERWEQSQG